MSGSELTHICSELGVEIAPELLELALTHRSWAYENGGVPTNERLEFLGDAVLGVVMTDHLYRSHPDVAEGHLAKLRAAVVNARALADVARGLGVPHYSVTESGPDHDKRFEAWAVVADHRWGPGKGRSKKQAEQEAAGKGFAAVQKIVAEQGRSASDEA